MIAAIAKKNKSSDHNYGNHFPEIVAIAATTIAKIELFLSHDRWKVVSIMIAMIAANFFSSAIAEIVAIIWKPSAVASMRPTEVLASVKF